MEKNNDNLEILEEELEEAPPILSNFNAENFNEPKNKIDMLKQDKKLKLDLINQKEKEIEQLKIDIEEIDELINKYKNQIIEEYEIIIETEEEIKNQEKEIKEIIFFLFENFKDINYNDDNEYNTFIGNNKEIVYKKFLFDDLYKFFDYVYEMVNNNDEKLKENIDKINKKLNIIKKRNLYFNEKIKSFFKEHKEEKKFIKFLISIKLKSFYISDRIELELKRQKINESNILMLNEYINSSNENKILFLNNSIDNIEYEIQELYKKAKESFKNSYKSQAKLFLLEKKYMSELLEKYKNELNNLK